MEDLISRQAVIDACDQSINLFEVVDRIEELPPVTPQPKTGKWVNKSQRSGCGIVFVASECTCCGKKTPFNCDEFIYRYCPNCGAKMQEVEE